MRLPRLAHAPSWTSGNRFELLENGERYFPVVFAAIRAAKEQVLIETFILFEDEVGKQLRDALLEAAANGAEVHLTIDGYGSPDLSAEFVQSLLDAGVRVHIYDSCRRLFGFRLNPLRRLHRKIVVVDGEVAFIGGINYSVDQLADSGPDGKQDYALRLEGPVVAEIHRFTQTQAGLLRRPRWWERGRSAPASGVGQALFVVRDNGTHRNDIERQYRAALWGAQREIIICNAYFFPGYRLMRQLCRAAERGVRVRLILQGNPDMPWARTCATLLYARLLRAGVEIHEYGRRPLHGKVAIADDDWATVGSSNLDPLSLALNLEANVFVRDKEFVQSLRQHLNTLIEQDCCRLDEREVVRGKPWHTLLHTLAYHCTRHFPAWAGWLPSRTQGTAQIHSAEEYAPPANTSAGRDTA